MIPQSRDRVEPVFIAFPIHYVFSIYGLIAKWLRSRNDCMLFEEGEVKHINGV